MNPTTKANLRPMLDRLVFTEDQLNNSLSNTVLVVCNDWNNTDVELTVFAPGLGPDVEGELHHGLFHSLQDQFDIRHYSEWVVGVKLSEDNKVVVEIDQPRHVPALRDMILDTVPLLLAPWIIDKWRTLYVVRESEKLVIAKLSIPYEEPGQSTFDLAFPFEIELHEGSHLQEHLLRSVRAFPFVRDVFVGRKNDQRIVSIMPNPSMHWSDRDANDMLRQLIGAFASQVQDSRLVFKLDKPYVNPDDGSDYEQPFVDY